MSSGDTLLVFSAWCNEPPASNYATPDARNGHPCLDFDGDANESAIFSAVMPQHYDGGGVMVRLYYAMTSAESGTIDWDVAFERIGDQQQDVDSDSFAAVNSVDDTAVPSTSGLVDVVEVPFDDGADMDSVAAGDAFRVKVTRDAVSDDAANDAELYFVELIER